VPLANPLETKDIANPLGKADAQALGAGLEVGALKVLSRGVNPSLAE